ncbi:hypothetical protein DFQ01_1509 [Paenibacillus cellulosilyticus]|uniref:Uncharacterized protein n=1 Tax=Paenibacillus cellulosilyticus TaxID=375489 RepID=A0A2V2YAH1_9BACL|nr:hypothetical protein DFQ01_1509 [Paenibacillus cellulosilyticus]
MPLFFICHELLSSTYVCVEIFDWKSIMYLRRISLVDAIIIVVTVVIVLATDE